MFQTDGSAHLVAEFGACRRDHLLTMRTAACYAGGRNRRVRGQHRHCPHRPPYRHSTEPFRITQPCGYLGGSGLSSPVGMLGGSGLSNSSAAFISAISIYHSFTPKRIFKTVRAMLQFCYYRRSYKEESFSRCSSCVQAASALRPARSREVKPVDRIFEGALAAPIANLLIVAGLIFLGIAAIGKVSGKIEPDATGRIVAGLVGTLILCLGLAIHFFPDRLRSDTAITPTTSEQPATATIAASPTVVLTPCPVPSTPTPPPIKREAELPFFMLREVTKADLQGKSCDQLDLMRNEVYARHGSKFTREDLRNYFMQQPWYRPEIDRDDSFEDRYFTETQKKNVEIIKYYQCDKGCSNVQCEVPSLIYNEWKQR